VCANYRPPPRERIRLFPLPEPDFGYGETYPGHVAPVLTSFDRHLWLPACFGLIPVWAKDATIARRTYNARSETVAEKPSFRSAWKRRQFCIIPADAFYEPCYESGKPVRWRIERADGRPMGLAGIWERRLKNDGLPSCGARQASCRLIHAALCCLFPMARTTSRSGLRVTTVMGDQSRVLPVQRAGWRARAWA